MGLFGAVLGSFWAVIGPNLWWLLPLVLIGVVFNATMPGRGPRLSRRDTWRLFKFDLRAEVLNRAGGRCEAAFVLFWGRCGSPAVEVDHVFPYSKGGPTVASNGQALCKSHNRRKGSLTPPWWYLLRLEKRRRAYFPPGTDVRVFALMTESDVAARLRSTGGRRSG
jgi:hypothetical protein